LYVLSSEPVKMPWFDSIFSNIGDENSLSQSPSNFSGHLKQTSVRYDASPVKFQGSKGLKAKPQFAVKFNQADIPTTHEQASAGFVFPTTRASERIGDIDVLIRRAERCLKAGADMISIDAEGVCRFAESIRSDIIAKVIGHLGLKKTMFEASNSKTSEWFIKQYGHSLAR
nr:protein heat-stress-associated 32 [Tanacetum cinerariifolium]